MRKKLSIILFIVAIMLIMVSTIASAKIEWLYMDYGQSSLDKISSGLVEVAGETQCWTTVDEARATVHLQKYYNGQWNTIETITFTSYNSDYAYGAQQYQVQTGYNYRVLTDHYVKEGSTVETTQSYTSSMYIN